jgi:ABC-type oligopeptide transport system substrate-binding subunit
MAIDKSKIGALLHGGQQAATSFVPPSLMGYSKNLGLLYSPENAKAEMKASGIGLSDSHQTLQMDLILPNWEKPVALAQFIQGELKKNLGIQVVLQPFDNKTYRARLDMHTYPLFSSSWSADFPDPDNFVSILMSSAGNNHALWKNPTFDNRVIEARHSVDPMKREKLYFELQRQILEEAVVVPLYYEPNKVLVKPRVQNLELNPLNYLNLKGVNLQP